MNALPVVAVALVVAELAGAVAFALNGSWVLAGLLGVGVVALVVVVRAVLVARRGRGPGRFVERERVGW